MTTMVRDAVACPMEWRLNMPTAHMPYTMWLEEEEEEEVDEIEQLKQQQRDLAESLLKERRKPGEPRDPGASSA